MTDDSVAESAGAREFLVVAHTGRENVLETIEAIARHCGAAGVALRVVDHDTLDRDAPDHDVIYRNRDDQQSRPGNVPVDPEYLRSLGAVVEVTTAESASAEGCELVIVLGGDGTFLRAAELACPAGVPVLGINLGHIGFLAESEAHKVDEVMNQLIARDYRIEPRMTLEIDIVDPADPDPPTASSWALNEVAILNTSKNGVLELVTEVDGRPVSAFGADGVLVATPTGSTAYAFSAGGPVMWPDLEAILVVPNNAHALFARPMVTSPRSRIAVEVDKNGRPAVALCDGRRALDVPAGARVEVVRSDRSVNWIRIDSDPFADRLVTKFALPVTGWRGRQA
ncbi:MULTISPECIES: NAD kinase [Gordonia]|uniref:NAD kinase n=1 Tax=Gordonia TaxID=2053 RepID=UPI0004B543FC|nr:MULTISPECIES: NAD kinase [Gordonia]MDH3007006.1 NAD kinase [Gordonia alkanivorans]MDH3018051.1 NAD kinase [Gordonia alkanivorans]MDH3020402.1 NAD kinase [Gordonia alkanivorans]MDH3024684.1 NAD kinase [Gordonia alkanivorans]MDH3043464.1 NAD kinase [Gordonia alkanivorans]